MADKKKKKVKQQKQKQKQKQSQQVIINVGRASQPRPAKQQQPMSSPQPPPVVQYVYRDNLALNMLNEKARTQEAKSALDKTISQAVDKAVVAQTPPPQEKPKLPQPNTPAPTNLMRLLNNNKIHNSTFIPQETKKLVAHDFEKIISKRKYDDETEFEDNNVPIRKPNQGRQPPTPIAEATTFTLPETAGVRLNKKGLPDRRSREGRLMYQQMMSQKNEEKSNDNAPTATSASTTNSASVQPVNFEPNDDEEEEFVVSPIKRKPG